MSNEEQEYLGLADAAKVIGRSPATIKSWIRDVGLTPAKDARNRYRIDPELLEAFKQVDELTKAGRHYESIRVLLKATKAEPSTTVDAPPTTVDAEAPPPSTPVDGDWVDNLEERMVAALVSAVKEQNDLARRYGQVERQLGAAEGVIAEKDMQLARMHAERDALAARAEALAVELAQARATLAALPAPKPKPIWRFW